MCCLNVTPLQSILDHNCLLAVASNSHEGQSLCNVLAGRECGGVRKMVIKKNQQQKAKMKYTVTNLFYDTMFDSILRGHKICE